MKQNILMLQTNIKEYKCLWYILKLSDFISVESLWQLKTIQKGEKLCLPWLFDSSSQLFMIPGSWDIITLVYQTIWRYLSDSFFWRRVNSVPTNCAAETIWPGSSPLFVIIFSLCWLLRAKEKLKRPSERAMLSFEMDISVVKLCTLIPLHLYEICTRAKQMNKQRWCSDVGVMVIHNPVMENRE